MDFFSPSVHTLSYEHTQEGTLTKYMWSTAVYILVKHRDSSCLFHSVFLLAVTLVRWTIHLFFFVYFFMLCPRVTITLSTLLLCLTFCHFYINALSPHKAKSLPNQYVLEFKSFFKAIWIPFRWLSFSVKTALLHSPILESQIKFKIRFCRGGGFWLHTHIYFLCKIFL